MYILNTHTHLYYLLQKQKKQPKKKITITIHTHTLPFLIKSCAFLLVSQNEPMVLKVVHLSRLFRNQFNHRVSV